MNETASTGRPTRGLVAAICAIALGLVAVVAALRQPDTARSNPGQPDSTRSARDLRPLERRDFVRRIRLTGLTEATKSYVVTAPLLAGSYQGAMVITRIAAAGSSVRSGDVLVEFDRQGQEKAALDKKAEYDDLVQQIGQKKAEQDAARVKDLSDLAQAKNAVEKYELEILKNEMLSRIKAEKNDQDLDEARAKLKALTDGFELKRSAATADLNILVIRRDRAQAAMEHATANATAMTIRSPLDGLVVPRMTWRGNGPSDIQEGDQLNGGAPVLEVVNQSSMIVRARVNQADVPELRPGMPVAVGFDAYPDLHMSGRVASVGPIGKAGSFSGRIRAFVSIIAVDGNNARLLPDLTAALDVEVERVSHVLVVPRDAVRLKDTQAEVDVRDGAGIVARKVSLGPSDDVDVVVTGGLSPGDVVVR